MTEDIRALLQIPPSRLESINQILADPGMKIINDFLDVVAKYGTPEEINAKAEDARQMSVLREKVAKIKPDYLKDPYQNPLQSSCGSRIVITGSPESPGPTIIRNVTSSASVECPSRRTR